MANKDEHQLSSDKESVRHKFVDRIFHWTAGVLILILLLSAFLPILGIKFDWLPWHWVSGVLLLFVLTFHIVRALFFQNFLNMIPKTDDIRELLFLSVKSSDPEKYNAAQKFYHLITAASVLVLAITGAFMLVKIDTPIWDRNPAILSDDQWGIIYVLHGLSSLVLIFLVIVHTYFTLIPEHRQFLISMIKDSGPKWARKKKND